MITSRLEAAVDSMAPTPAEPPEIATAGWDPYEVWRTRVLLPRLVQDARPHPETVTAQQPGDVARPDVGEERGRHSRLMTPRLRGFFLRLVLGDALWADYVLARASLLASGQWVAGVRFGALQIAFNVAVRR